MGNTATEKTTEEKIIDDEGQPDKNTATDKTTEEKIIDDEEPDTVCTQLEEGDNKPGRECKLTQGYCRYCGACEWRDTQECKDAKPLRTISGNKIITKLKDLGVDDEIQKIWMKKLGFTPGPGTKDYKFDIECCVNSKKNDVIKKTTQKNQKKHRGTTKGQNSSRKSKNKRKNKNDK